MRASASPVGMNELQGMTESADNYTCVQAIHGPGVVTTKEPMGGSTG